MHRATLRTGRDVAVKVQRPNVERRLMSDISAPGIGTVMIGGKMHRVRIALGKALGGPNGDLLGNESPIGCFGSQGGGSRLMFSFRGKKR